MDRRKEDRGFDARPHSFYVAINHLGQIIPQPKRSGQDRREHDLLAEARDMAYNASNIPVSCPRTNDAIKILAESNAKLITMLEKRGK